MAETSDSARSGKKMLLAEAIRSIDRDERFKATVYAMNTLLIQKGVYTTEEFEAYFCQFVESRLRERETEAPM